MVVYLLTLYGGPTLTTPLSPAHLLLANWSHPISRLSPVDIMGRQPIGLAEVPRGVVSPSPFPMRGWGEQLWRHSSTPPQIGTDHAKCNTWRRNLISTSPDTTQLHSNTPYPGTDPSQFRQEGWVGGVTRQLDRSGTSTREDHAECHEVPELRMRSCLTTITPNHQRGSPLTVNWV